MEPKTPPSTSVFDSHRTLYQELAISTVRSSEKNCTSWIKDTSSLIRSELQSEVEQGYRRYAQPHGLREELDRAILIDDILVKLPTLYLFL